MSQPDHRPDAGTTPARQPIAKDTPRPDEGHDVTRAAPGTTDTSWTGQASEPGLTGQPGQAEQPGQQTDRDADKPVTPPARGSGERPR